MFSSNCLCKLKPKNAYQKPFSKIFEEVFEELYCISDEREYSKTFKKNEDLDLAVNIFKSRNWIRYLIFDENQKRL